MKMGVCCLADTWFLSAVHNSQAFSYGFSKQQGLFPLAQCTATASEIKD